MNLNQFKKILLSHLKDKIEVVEIDSISKIIHSRIDNNGRLVAKSADGDNITIPLDEVVERLSYLEPIDYILGYKPFMELQILVNEHTLIPRPETEELVYMVKEHWKNRRNEPLNILDIGTGSGCIALSMKYYFSKANIFGIDLSEQALVTARRNADLNKLDVKFNQIDFLDLTAWPQWATFYDIIISNPPYISENEIEHMDNSVLTHEPKMALFPKGDDALIFYRAISQFGQQYLKEDGNIFVECNALRASEIKQIFGGYPLQEIINDMQGNPRILKAASALGMR